MAKKRSVKKYTATVSMHFHAPNWDDTEVGRLWMQSKWLLIERDWIDTLWAWLRAEP